MTKFLGNSVMAAVLTVGLATAAHSDQTLNGAMGLVLNPTGQIPAQGQIHVQADYFPLGDSGGGGASIFNFKDYGIHAAGRVGRVPLEISGGIERFHSSDPFALGFANLDKTGVTLGAKYLIAGEKNPNGIQIAAGVGYSQALLKNVHAYVVASKSLFNLSRVGAPVMGHLGVRYDRFSLADIAGPKSNKGSVYGGLEIPLTRDGTFSLVGELQSKNNDLGREGAPYSAGLNFHTRDGAFSARAGIQRQGILNDHKVFAQIGYAFHVGARRP